MNVLYMPPAHHGSSHIPPLLLRKTVLVLSNHSRVIESKSSSLRRSPSSSNALVLHCSKEVCPNLSTYGLFLRSLDIPFRFSAPHKYTGELAPDATDDGMFLSPNYLNAILVIRFSRDLLLCARKRRHGRWSRWTIFLELPRYVIYANRLETVLNACTGDKQGTFTHTVKEPAALVRCIRERIFPALTQTSELTYGQTPALALMLSSSDTAKHPVSQEFY